MKKKQPTILERKMALVSLISVEEYGVRYSMACHSSITQSMRNQLVSKSFVDPVFCRLSDDISLELKPSGNIITSG